MTSGGVTRGEAAPAGLPGWATIVDPIRFAAELDDDIDRRRSGGPNMAVASIDINGLSDLRRRFGALFVFDLVSDLVRLLHDELRPGDLHCVGEDGHVVLVGRGHTIDETTAMVRALCRVIASHRWDDDGEDLRLTASAGLSTLDDGDSAADVVGCAVDARLRSAGARGHTTPPDRSALSVWSLGGAEPLHHGVESPRRVRGPVVATGPLAGQPKPERSDRRGDDIFSLVEFRPQPESTRLATAMVLPPQGSAMGIPLLAVGRRSEPMQRTAQTPRAGAIERPHIDDDTPTHTRATLDAIQTSLASHAAAALAAFDASLGCRSVDDPPSAEVVEAVPADQSFDLPVRDRKGPTPGPLPQRQVGGGVRRS